ncbi:MAG: putative NRPS-like protein biosynthetic cluster [Bathelium mastoideum]|nr:MAG: putative NRPS-like protein biosynthetic cluster [Bathelium mastoideum]
MALKLQNGDHTLLEREPLTIDELICQRAVEPGCDESIFAYASIGIEYEDYTPEQLNQFATKAASIYGSFLPPRRTLDYPVHVVALLGTSHLGYLATLLGVSKLGHTVLFLSTRLSEEAYISLLTATNATTLLIDPAYQWVADAAHSKVPELTAHPVCTFSQLEALSSAPSRTDVTGVCEPSQVAWIIHSSGSTSLPKPIYQTHKAALRNYATNFGLRGFITLPLFHAHGLSCTFRAIHSKKKIYMYNANLPLASQHLITTLTKHHDIKIFYAVPYALKLLGESEEGMKLLAELDTVTFGGSACPKVLGDRLTAAGVHLVSHYGTTETGQLLTSARSREDKEWDYLRPLNNAGNFLQMEPQGDAGLYELCVRDGWPSKVMTNRDDGSYATKDLFEAHPSRPNLWKYYARKDDTIVLDNGEKANPLHIEGIAREDFRVAEAIVFGSNKPRLGMFIIPSDVAVHLSDNEIVDTIWPEIESANNRMPAYGRLSKDMIRVLRQANYRRTDKGTVIRAAFYRDFNQQIEAVYQEMEAAGGTKVLSREDLIIWLKTTIADLLGLKDPSILQDSTDLFAIGVDSLQSAQIRTAIVRNIDTGGKPLGLNIVFDFPTPASLADELIQLQSGTEARSLSNVEDRMEAMIATHSSFEPHMPVSVSISAHSECIIVTGATGSLGAHLVAHLAARQNVERIYCLVRAPNYDVALTRIERSLQDRGVYAGLPMNKIVATPSSLGDAKLGLEDHLYNELASKVTSVIHCAWSVNFNLALESFENDCVAGTKNLISFCLRTRRAKPASFNFCSSVSTVVRTPPGETIREALPASLSYAQSMGYAQSKLVAEYICRAANEQTGITTRVLRIGQIIGDTIRGIWNPTEAIPLIFRTADTVGVLPSLDETPSWLPVDTVAAAVSDIALSTTEAPVVNVVNSKTFHWTEDLLPLLRVASLNFEAVDQREWVRRLRASNPDPAANPPIKLVDFFAQKYDREGPSPKLDFASDIAQSLSPALQRVGALDPKTVTKFVEYLTSVWHNTKVR